MVRPRSHQVAALLLLLSVAGPLACAEPPAATPAPEQSEPSVAQAQAEAEPAAEAEGPAPVIASPADTFDFGTIKPKQSVSHVFTIENRGAADLHIERVERT